VRGQGKTRVAIAPHSPLLPLAGEGGIQRSGPQASSEVALRGKAEAVRYAYASGKTLDETLGRQAGEKAQMRSAYREAVVCFEQAPAALVQAEEWWPKLGGGHVFSPGSVAASLSDWALFPVSRTRA
jgi:hypothetical protein